MSAQKSPGGLAWAEKNAATVKYIERLKRADCVDCQRDCPDAGTWAQACRDWMPEASMPMRPQLPQPDQAAEYPVQ